jgi:uncharacterized protein (TIGR02147 family)
MTIHLILQKYLQKKQKSQSGFSLRLLAKTLEVSPSFLSRVLSGQKPVPYAMLLKLKSLLDIEAEVFESLRASYDETATAPKASVKNPANVKVRVKTAVDGWELTEKSSLGALRQWFYLPVLEFLTLKNFDGTTEQIARRLKVSKTAVEIATSEMLSLGLIEIDNGRFRKTAAKLRWGSAKSLKEIRRFHEQMLVRAQETLQSPATDKDFKARLITGITLTANPEKIEAAKRKLSECMHEIANELTGEEGTEVYHLATQLFPLTDSDD